MISNKLSFQKQVDDWTKKSDARLQAVFQESTQDLIDIAQKPKAKGGNMPVLDGFLRNSGVAALNSVPTGPSRAPKGYRDTDWDASASAIVIASANIGDRVVFGWTAEYARRMEYGFSGKDSLGRTYNQKGNGFMRLAAQKWQFIVKNAATRVRKTVAK